MGNPIVGQSQTTKTKDPVRTEKNLISVKEEVKIRVNAEMEQAGKKKETMDRKSKPPINQELLAKRKAEEET